MTDLQYGEIVEGLKVLFPGDQEYADILDSGDAKAWDTTFEKMQNESERLKQIVDLSHKLSLVMAPKLFKETP